MSYRYLRLSKDHKPFAAMRYEHNRGTGEVEMVFSFCSPLDLWDKRRGKELVDKRWCDAEHIPLKSKLQEQESISMCALRNLEALMKTDSLPQWLRDRKGFFNASIIAIIAERHSVEATKQMKSLGRTFVC